MTPRASDTGASHAVWVDVAKVVASQLIVLHHVAFYGPMADVAWSLAPALFEFFARHARMAVQVFLVVGGFLAVRQLAELTLLKPKLRLGRVLATRYLRLVVPLTAMFIVAIAAAGLARQWMTHPSMGEPASLWQLLLHVLLLQDIAGVPALSAGVWYVAIDFQLYVLLATLLWLGRAMAWTWFAPVSVAGLTVVSLLVFNRMAWLDTWALYFLGAYGLGALAAWWPVSVRMKQLTVLVLAMVVIALIVAWRPRLVVAVVTALSLWGFGRFAPLADHAARRVNALARQSYALFLIHFPVLLVVNAFFTRFVPADPWWQAAGMACGWLASMGAAWAFHRWVEVPSMRLLARRLPKHDLR